MTSEVQTGKKIHFINAFISLFPFKELEKRLIFLWFCRAWNERKVQNEEMEVSPGSFLQGRKKIFLIE